ncbi:Protein PHYTOCHROME KINASE SUBSTRATE 1 [Rhynchospora pubera]|uniref:Protein PHYTOCHROME KINASE SUBSTRATE 1 n=1 Tax=Rhynchospora pubera TaxID=906938 RepID=A0AAV8ALN6_9POAL|nr:Protein PHYTOCHROME KINASE SUBSTRATE 1 [Rhynchospora pubera]KAJ4820285.1 Protein PHYTOCHROME KINASE SUBSTRATE 1 [Rhynchospora pubera]
MATVTAASPYANTSSINPRDDSFSSYLNLVRESFHVELNHTGRNHSSIQFNSRKQRGDDGEIDIFGAEKYFNGTMDYKNDILPNKDLNLPDKNEGKRSVKSKSRRAASTCSEASGNSRTGLLRQNSKVMKSEGKNLLGVLLCSCSGKKATDTDEEVVSARDSCGERNMMDEIKMDREMRMKRLEIGFTENLFGGPANLKGLQGTQVSEREIRDCERRVSACSRESLNPSEFQLASFNNVLGGSSTGDAYNGHDVGGDDICGHDNDDICSESSSDLFEISSISVNSHSFFDPDMDNSAIYEPSEASIQWSVVTASAANFSVESQLDEPKIKSTKESRKGMLMGCVSHKAVNVTTDSHQYKLTKRANAVETPVQLGHEGIVAPAMRHRIQSLKKTELRSGPPRHATRKSTTQPISHIQARQPIYMQS